MAGKDFSSPAYKIIMVHADLWELNLDPIPNYHVVVMYIDCMRSYSHSFKERQLAMCRYHAYTSSTSPHQLLGSIYVLCCVLCACVRTCVCILCGLVISWIHCTHKSSALGTQQDLFAVITKNARGHNRYTKYFIQCGMGVRHWLERSSQHVIDVALSVNV